MRTEPLAADPTALANTPLPRSALQRVVDTGLLRCAVPPALGGTGGTLPDLAAGARHLREHDAEAADILRAQRLAIEALVRSRNVALRELWLPDLLTGLRAGTVALDGPPLSGHDTGRGWLLTGRFERIANLPWEGFSLVAPAHLGDGPASWVLLRSEEDGLSVEAPQAAAARGSSEHGSALRMNPVFFREDEWLGGPELRTHLAPVAAALSGGQPGAPT